MAEALHDLVEAKYMQGDWHIVCWDTDACLSVLKVLLEWGVSYELDNRSKEVFQVQIMLDRYLGANMSFDDLTQAERQKFWAQIKKCR